MRVIYVCERCEELIPGAAPEYCWWCLGFLCSGCWDELGHCGHPEAEAVNERARAVAQPGDVR